MLTTTGAGFSTQTAALRLFTLWLRLCRLTRGRYQRSNLLAFDSLLGFLQRLLLNVDITPVAECGHNEETFPYPCDRVVPSSLQAVRRHVRPVF
jgi:hypothetical protein